MEQIVNKKPRNFHEEQVSKYDLKRKSHKLSVELSGQMNDPYLKGYRKRNVSWGDSIVDIIYTRM